MPILCKTKLLKDIKDNMSRALNNTPVSAPYEEWVIIMVTISLDFYKWVENII